MNDNMKEDPTWVEVTRPLVMKLKTVEHFGQSITFNKKGATAVGKLIHGMAVNLDRMNGRMDEMEVILAELKKEKEAVTTKSNPLTTGPLHLIYKWLSNHKVNP